MPKYKDMAGQTFGEWTVERFSHSTPWTAFWVCRCSCGKTAEVASANLRRGQSTQCQSCARSTHGHSSRHTNPGLKSKRSPTYTSWLSMLSRIRQSSKSEKLRYGYAHVSICERWYSYENFLADMGERPEGTTLDRVDNSGNYEPGNCRWADWSTQLKNRRPRRH